MLGGLFLLNPVETVVYAHFMLVVVLLLRNSCWGNGEFQSWCFEGEEGKRKDINNFYKSVF
jgi:membrane protein required for beta-lactamase induction